MDIEATIKVIRRRMECSPKLVEALANQAHISTADLHAYIDGQPVPLAVAFRLAEAMASDAQVTDPLGAQSMMVPWGAEVSL